MQEKALVLALLLPAPPLAVEPKAEAVCSWAEAERRQLGPRQPALERLASVRSFGRSFWRISQQFRPRGSSASELLALGRALEQQPVQAPHEGPRQPALERLASVHSFGRSFWQILQRFRPRGSSALEPGPGLGRAPLPGPAWGPFLALLLGQRMELAPGWLPSVPSSSPSVPPSPLPGSSSSLGAVLQPLVLGPEPVAVVEEGEVVAAVELLPFLSLPLVAALPLEVGVVDRRRLLVVVVEVVAAVEHLLLISEPLEISAASEKPLLAAPLD